MVRRASEIRWALVERAPSLILIFYQYRNETIEKEINNIPIGGNLYRES